MENKYIETYIDSELTPIEYATPEIKKSADFDSDYGKPYGFKKADGKQCSSNFQDWFIDLNTIYSIMKDCKEHGGFATTITIIKYTKDGKEDGASHTSFDSHLSDFKKLIDSGDLAGADIILTVFKNNKVHIDKNDFNDIFEKSNE